MLTTKKDSRYALKKKLVAAGINKTPDKFMSEVLKNSILVGVLMTVFMFLLAKKTNIPLIFVLLVGGLFFFMTYITMLRSVDAKISKKAKSIDKDVLFAGRFLLVKLNSGKPLINSLVDASQSYGVASLYFKELVREIDLGTPLEAAIDKAIDTCPSKKMKKVLFQINNALKIGIDVSQNLEAVLDEITAEQLVEIQRYGKKLNSLTLFYMLIAVVMPSLGLTMFIVVAGLVSLEINAATFFAFAFFMLLTELLFMSIFKSIRPNVNI